MTPGKRVAVIGAGPAGAITVDALAREQAFDIIRVFERREGPGGCWLGDASPPPHLTDLKSLGDRTADTPLPIPETLPALVPKPPQPRFAETSIYPYLETNVDHLPMAFSQEPIPEERTELSMSLHGPQTPFRHWDVMRRYVSGLFERGGYEDLVSYNTTVELVEKVAGEWKVTLRKAGKKRDYWWTEIFDAVVVASGHYTVPYIPPIPGLEEMQKARPGSVIHSKHFRGRDHLKDKRVVVVGASVSAADIAYDLVINDSAKKPVHAIVLGHTPNGYFGDEAFNHPDIQKQPSISHVELTPTSTRAGRFTVHLVNGASIEEVDHIIFGTGYSWTLPFLPKIPIRNNRVPGLWQHVVWQQDPTLLFVGAVGAGLTFKIFEWQAVLAARILADRLARPLPNLKEMQRWEADRIAARGDGAKFTLVFPDFKEYFETVRSYAGDGEQGLGRKLPEFRQEWFKAFMDGHELRKAMWRRGNARARQGATEAASENKKRGGPTRAKL